MLSPGPRPASPLTACIGIRRAGTEVPQRHDCTGGSLGLVQPVKSLRRYLTYMSGPHPEEERGGPSVVPERRSGPPEVPPDAPRRDAILAAVGFAASRFLAV